MSERDLHVAGAVRLRLLLAQPAAVPEVNLLLALMVRSWKLLESAEDLHRRALLAFEEVVQERNCRCWCSDLSFIRGCRPDLQCYQPLQDIPSS